MSAITFDHTLRVAVPGDFRQALVATARARGLSLPDLIRRELQAALVREHVPFRGFPDLERAPVKRDAAPNHLKELSP